MSNKLVKKEWREFFVSEIFTKIQRGKRLTKGNQQNGEVPYVSSTAANNGVDNFIGNSKGVRIFENCLTLANSGSVGSTFFHHYTFVASDHVTALILERPNKYIYLFLSGIIRRLEEKYSFNREINDKRIQREKILLPVNSDGLPDWQFMEDFIKQKEQKQIVDLKDYYADKAVELMISTGSLKNTEWQEFKIGKIFEQLLRGNNKGHSNEDCQFGVSYNGAKYNDNGVTGFVETNGKFKIFKGNAIVFVMTGEGSVGLSVYKKEDFVPSSNVFVGYSSVLNRWNGLFLVTAINNGADRYNYGYIRNEKRLFNEKILLPVNSDGLPDWQFMEDFMKQIERDKIATVLSYYNNSLNNNGLRGGRALDTV
jgi:restriction enzyme